MKSVAFIILGIIVSLVLVTLFEDMGLMIIMGIALGSLFSIVYHLGNKKGSE